MKQIREKQKAVSLALGTFDGLHTGHQRVIENALNIPDGEAFILLFYEHPQKYLTGRAPTRLITKTEEERLLKGFGIAPVYTDFGEIMELNAEDFIIRLTRQLPLKQISCGFNYRFGKNAAGTTETLKILCDENAVRLKVAQAVLCDGAPVSSTRIREAVENGDMAAARRMLGRCFSYDFEVQTGDRRGKTLGFPTINQRFPDDFTVPLTGVYAASAEVSGKICPAVTNIGVRPTVGDNVFGSETHIIGINENLYGQPVRVELMERLRSEIRFQSLEALTEQIASDSTAALDIWRKYHEQTD